jgi:hypothetical protein
MYAARARVCVCVCRVCVCVCVSCVCVCVCVFVQRVYASLPVPCLASTQAVSHERLRSPDGTHFRTIATAASTRNQDFQSSPTQLLMTWRQLTRSLMLDGSLPLAFGANCPMVVMYLSAGRCRALSNGRGDGCPAAFLLFVCTALLALTLTECIRQLRRFTISVFLCVPCCCCVSARVVPSPE